MKILIYRSWSLIDQIAFFAGYGFNKSHSVPYALLAYQTAYLKANYPAEYIAASLTAVKRDKDRTAIFLSEAREMGVKVSTPDINRSESDFTVNDNEILFGLSAVRNVGDITADKIVLERRENGTFKSIEDFLSRIDSAITIFLVCDINLYRPGFPEIEIIFSRISLLIF